MRRWLVMIAALMAAAVVLPSLLQGQDAQAVVGRSARVYRSLSSLKADFIQIINNPMIDSAESRGTLVQAGPSKLSMRFSDPPGEAIVIDGEHVWVYTPSTTPGQVIRMAVPTGGPVYGYNILAWILDRPNERYDTKYLRTEELNGQSTDMVELTPRVPDLPFDRAVVWLARGDALPRKLEIHERSGATRILTLSKLRVNQSVPDQTFTFQVPSGVRIVDQ